MGTLWTPDGERPVPPRQTDVSDRLVSDGQGRSPDELESIRAQADALGIDLDTLSPDERAAAMDAVEEMVATRQRLASVPAAEVVANHAMGLYELAAIHLSSDPPSFGESAIAIDAMRGIINQLGDRLGEAAPVLQQAMSQIQMAFVSIKKQSEMPGSTTPDAAETSSDTDS